MLYELATCFDSYGELSLGFSKRGHAELLGIARDLATEFESDARCRDGAGLRAAKARRHPHPHHHHHYYRHYHHHRRRHHHHHRHRSSLAASVRPFFHTSAAASFGRPSMPDPSPNPNPNQALDAGLYHIKSNRAKARVKEDEKRIKRFIEAREGGYAAFDKLVIAMVMNVVDATKWALRCKECHNQASRRRHTRSPLPPATPLPTPPRHLPPPPSSPGEPHACARGGAAPLHRAQASLPPPAQAGGLTL